MSLVARVLYEDQPVGRVFAPHLFILACVADRLGGTSFELMSWVEDLPLKGAGNMVRALRRPECDRIVPDGLPLFALIDGDQLWRSLGLEHGASDDQLLHAIFGGVQPDRVSVFVLRENMETLCRAILDCGFTGSPWSPDRRPKPSLDERDKLLMRAAESWTPDGRARVLARVPAVGALVEALVAVCLA